MTTRADQITFIEHEADERFVEGLYSDVEMLRSIAATLRADREAAPAPWNQPDANHRTPVMRLKALVLRLSVWDEAQDVTASESEELLLDIKQCLDQIVPSLEAGAARPGVAVAPLIETEHARVMELCLEHGVTEPDILKHRLEDWDRWSRMLRTGELEARPGVAVAPKEPTGQ